MAGKLNRWLVKLDDKTICVYADQKNNTLYCKTFGANGWEEKVSVIGDVAGNLSVTIGEDRNLYVFCTDVRGNIVLCVNKGGVWSSSIIQENKMQSVYDIYFHVCMTAEGMDIIYNFPDGPEKTYGLYYRNVSRGSRWSEPVRIDTIAVFNNTPFVVQKVGGNHYVVFYHTKRQETNIVYREVSFDSKKWSDSHQVFKSGYNCRDVSLLTTNIAIHALIIIQGMFSYQLLYVKKQGGEFSKPVLLYEGQRVENCLVQILDGNVYCTFFVGGQMYICKSDNMGESFSRPSKYKYSYDIGLIKTVFISESPVHADKAFLSYVYTEEDNIGSIALVTDFYPNILIPKAKPVPVNTVKAEKKQPPAVENDYDGSYGFFPSMDKSPAASVQNAGTFQADNANIPVNDNEFLKNQVLYLTRQIEKKEQQINNLSVQIKENERLAASRESDWKEKYAQLSEQSKSAVAELERRLYEAQGSYTAVINDYGPDAAIASIEPEIPDDYAQIIGEVFDADDYVVE